MEFHHHPVIKSLFLALYTEQIKILLQNYYKTPKHFETHDVFLIST